MNYMNDYTSVVDETSTSYIEHSSRRDDDSATLWHKLALALVLLVSAFLNLFRLDQNGYGNTYYAAAIKSMLMNWHNFFFLSFDPGGFVSIDKPPLGFWLQAASARLFGFNGWSLLLPQALAGIASVALLYVLLRRVFGPTMGVLAALALAITPVSVAAARNNTPDTLLVLVTLLAALVVSIAAETGRLRWLLLGALLVGLGFNLKMFEAYLVLPALILVYLLAAPLPLHMIANSVAFLLSAQVNFLFSTSFTWGDRLVQQHKGLLRRWLAFHGSILGTAPLNQLVFLLVRLLLPNEIAVVLGIGVAALANFVLLDRQVFRQKRSFVIDQQKRDTEQELKNKNSCRK